MPFLIKKNTVIKETYLLIRFLYNLVFVFSTTFLWFSPGFTHRLSMNECAEKGWKAYPRLQWDSHVKMSSCFSALETLSEGRFSGGKEPRRAPNHRANWGHTMRSSAMRTHYDSPQLHQTWNYKQCWVISFNSKANREATCQFPSGDWNIEYFLWYLHVSNYSRQRKSYVLEIILSPPGRSHTMPIMSFTVIILPLKNPTSYLKNTSAVGLAFWSTRSFCWSACFQGPLDKALLQFLPVAPTACSKDIWGA